MASDLFIQISKLTKLDDSVENQVIDKKKAANIYIAVQEHKRLSERVSFKGAVTAIIITNRLKTKIKMANTLEIIKTASTFVPEFDGNSEKLNRVFSVI